MENQRIIDGHLSYSVNTIEVGKKGLVMDTESGNITTKNSNNLLLSNNMILSHDTLVSASNPLITIMQVFCLAELAIDKKDVVYWTVSENLDKHRETREFDVHIQKMLLFLEKIGAFQAEEVPCGGNGFYRTLLKNPQTNESILVVHSWDSAALYMKKYLQMNLDISNPKFALIQYDLNKQRTQLQNLRFVIPVEGGLAYAPNNLMPLVQEVRKPLALGTHNVSENIQSIKTRLQQIEIPDIKEIDT